MRILHGQYLSLFTVQWASLRNDWKFSAKTEDVAFNHSLNLVRSWLTLDHSATGLFGRRWYNMGGADEVRKMGRG